jgi:uncharacterized protein YnzC (UPF0291/DUF896 family)
VVYLGKFRVNRQKSITKGLYFMEMTSLIARINFLYHKRREHGLTEAETEEQKELRSQYLEIIKGNVKSQLSRFQLTSVNSDDQCRNPYCNCHKH